MSVTTQTTARREKARVKDGKFGHQPHTESGVVAPLHGDEIRTQVTAAVTDAMGGPYLLEPGVSPYVVVLNATDPHPIVDINLVEISRGPYATPDAVTRVSRLLPSLPPVRASFHADQIAQAHLMMSLYDSPEIDMVSALPVLQESAASNQLVLTQAPQLRDTDDWYGLEEWVDAESNEWAAEHFRRASAAVDEDRRRKAGMDA